VSSLQWIEISSKALFHNLNVFRHVLTEGTEMAAVVKANAYGHGLSIVAPAIEDQVDYLAVHSAQEARELRRIGVRKPILVMGFIPPSELYGFDREIHVLVSTSEEMEWIRDYRQRESVSLPVHLKVETGTNRQGFRLGELASVGRAAARNGLEIVGVGTHFANIEDTLEHAFARRQLDVFREAVERVTKELGSAPPLVHAACSAAALLFREADFTMVRVGIGMYGHWPSRETRLSWILEHGRNGVELEPVLTWKTTVGQVKEVPEGETVGYGRTWQALRPTRLAVLPVGYSDGYPRALGNRGRVLVNGNPAPVVGRVCMNILLADVTDHSGVSVGDEAVLLGRVEGEEISAEEVAELSHTINYEILSRLSTEIERRLLS